MRNIQLYPMTCCQAETLSVTQHDLYHVSQALTCSMTITLNPEWTAIQLSELCPPLLPGL